MDFNIFPNIGTYIGKVSALKHFYNWKTYEQIKTDQGHRQLLSDEHTLEIILCQTINQKI